ncbi:unnamed protein product [Camellia sinensis]
MKKRSTRKSSVADLLVSPPTITSPNRSSSESPKHFEFNLGAFNTTSSSKKKKNDVASSSVLIQPTASPPHLKSLSTISDLKELASSRLDSIKRQLDRSHSEILKDMEASQSRLHKRFKLFGYDEPDPGSQRLHHNYSFVWLLISKGSDGSQCKRKCTSFETVNQLVKSCRQTQACQQVTDEAEKEYKKMSERISESREAMKASYLGFLAEAQASASRACKTSIPELSQSFEKALDVLRSRYGISSSAV